MAAIAIGAIGACVVCVMISSSLSAGAGTLARGGGGLSGGGGGGLSSANADSRKKIKEITDKIEWDSQDGICISKTQDVQIDYDNTKHPGTKVMLSNVVTSVDDVKNKCIQKSDCVGFTFLKSNLNSNILTTYTLIKSTPNIYNGDEFRGSGAKCYTMRSPDSTRNKIKEISDKIKWESEDGMCGSSTPGVNIGFDIKQHPDAFRGSNAYTLEDVKNTCVLKPDCVGFTLADMKKVRNSNSDALISNLVKSRPKVFYDSEKTEGSKCFTLA